MRSQSLHLAVLVILLAVIGVGVTVYQIFVLQIPLTEHETDHLWNIEAKIEFQASSDVPIKTKLYVPPLDSRFVSVSESFISKDYGVTVDQEEDNRQITWSARRVTGEQTLFYRLVVTARYGGETTETEGPVYRDPIEIEGEAEQEAVETLIQPIRQYSADIETFISEAIKRVNKTDDDAVQLLLHHDDSVEHKVNVLELVLASAHVPMERVHTVLLNKSNAQDPELWVRSYNGQEWLYFNPVTGERGLPDNRLVWWYGDAPLIDIEGGANPTISFAISSSEVNAIRLGQLIDNANATTRFLDYSLYGLPLNDQQIYHLIIMIPVGVLFILLLRNFIGLQTLGTFTPVLVALAFRETGLAFGAAFFTIITAFGLLLRSYLEYLKLQLLPRLSVVLTFVVIIMAVISLFSHKLGMESGLSVSLFPMVILTMMIERLSIAWDERGGNEAFKKGVITLIAAAGAYYLMNIPALEYFMFTFPGVLLVMAAFMLLMGKYRGYRLTELVRFKAMLDDER